MLSKQQLEEFKELNKQHFGKDISDQDALDRGIKLVRLMGLIYKPTFKNEHKNLEEQ